MGRMIHCPYFYSSLFFTQFTMSTQNKITIAMSPAQMFIAGIVTGLLVLCTVGFFLLGGFGGFSGKTAKANTNTGGGAAVVPTDNGAPSGPITLRDVDDTDHIRGNKNAKLTIVEYSDFECPFCQRFHPTMNRVLAEYGDQVAWVYRHFPLSIHANAQKAAEASECVAKLGGEEAFWNFSDLYFERTTSNGTGFPLDGLADLAAEVGVDAAAVQTCLDNDEMADRVQEDVDGGARGGVTGTPGTIVVTDGGPQELIPGALPYEQVSQVIDRYL